MNEEMVDKSFPASSTHATSLLVSKFNDMQGVHYHVSNNMEPPIG